MAARQVDAVALRNRVKTGTLQQLSRIIIHNPQLDVTDPNKFEVLDFNSLSLKPPGVTNIERLTPSQRAAVVEMALQGHAPFFAQVFARVDSGRTPCILRRCCAFALQLRFETGKLQSSKCKLNLPTFAQLLRVSRPG